MPPKFGIVKTLDKARKVSEALEALGSQRVYAGVPADKAGRDETEGQPINNATLMYIHENGAPEANIPERPVVHPAIKSIQSQIKTIMRNGAKLVLKGGNKDTILRMFNTMGLLAQNAMRKRISEGPFIPLSPRTIAARMARGRKAFQFKNSDVYGGGLISSDEHAAGSGTRPLIDTGQLRRSLTYVIRKFRGALGLGIWR